MKTQPNDPAQPTTEPGPNGEWSQGFGLTKREVFAAMAMTGIMSMIATGAHSAPNGEIDVAKIAVKQADALIEALNEKP